MSIIRALIVGIGIVGERHLKAQIKCKNHTGVFDNSKDKVLRIKEKFPNIHTFHDLEEALDWCTLVHICTPDNLHGDIAKKAIQKNKAIICEKPFTTNLAEAEMLAGLVKTHNTIFVVGNNARLTPTFMSIKKRIIKKELGLLLSIRSTYLHDMRKLLKQTPWRRDQNFLWGGGIHAIDLILWLINDEVAEVIALTGRKMMKELLQEQDYQILLKFNSGLVAQVWINARVSIPVHKIDLEVYGEKGSLIANNKSRFLKIYKESRIRKFKTKEYLNEPVSLGYQYTLNKEIEILNNFITGKSKSHYPLPNIQEALRTTKVIDLIIKKLNH